MFNGQLDKTMDRFFITDKTNGSMLVVIWQCLIDYGETTELRYADRVFYGVDSRGTPRSHVKNKHLHKPPTVAEFKSEIIGAIHTTLGSDLKRSLYKIDLRIFKGYDKGSETVCVWKNSIKEVWETGEHLEFLGKL